MALLMSSLIHVAGERLNSFGNKGSGGIYAIFNHFHEDTLFVCLYYLLVNYLEELIV